MKKGLFTLAILINITVYYQSLIAKTEDGRRVLLKNDNKWEFIDLKPVTEKNSSTENNCVIDKNFVEPKSEKSINSWLKKFDATTDDLKKHVAVDNNCAVTDVVLLNISEQKGNGIYSLCVKGEVIKYRRAGSVFFRADEDPMKKK
jgi:hypothetical protein